MDSKAIIITGPIGSGKSTALSIIKKLGYNTIDLDEVSGAILTSDESIEFLSENFPTTIVDNEVSRKKIADIVFDDKLQLEKLENFLHPKILNNLNEIINKNEGITFVEVSAPKNMYLPLAVFVCAIVLAAFGLLPVEVAFGGAVLVMVMANVIPVRKLYDSIDVPVIILLAAMIPIGHALRVTGGTQLITDTLLHLSKHQSPEIILGLVLVVTMTLSDFMNNAATTVVMAPIAVSLAKSLHVAVDPFLMAVAIGASCSFLTPVGHQNNTLVMGPGGYKFTDFIRVGLPLEILVVIVSMPLLLHFWPMAISPIA